MTLRHRLLSVSILLYIISQFLFLINIQFPRSHNFDEFHYVPAAKQYLKWGETKNTEHPPLGKIFMAIGIKLLGDRPIGWRFMSTVFGSLTLVGIYLLGIALFRNQEMAFWIAMLTLFNQLLYVQARIGMLDTFMFAFIIWGLLAFVTSWDRALRPEKVRRLWAFTGVMMGLATACKWYGVVPLFTCLGLVLIVRLLQKWEMNFAKPNMDDWYNPFLWLGMRPAEWLLWLFILPIVVYLLACTPAFMTAKSFQLKDIFLAQKEMWDLQQRVVSSHPYMSDWPGWFIMKRPIWYAFDREGWQKQFVRGVILLGNPLIMWGGILALIGCLWGWVQYKHRDAFLILAFYSAFYLSWAVIPRKVSFYYYYYPAGMMLSYAIGYVFHRGERGQFFQFPWARWVFLGVTVGLFIYFFPVIAAIKIPTETFRKWMWLSSWI